MGDISLTKHHVRRHMLSVCPIINKIDNLVKMVSPTFFFVINKQPVGSTA